MAAAPAAPPPVPKIDASLRPSDPKPPGLDHFLSPSPAAKGASNRKTPPSPLREQLAQTHQPPEPSKGPRTVAPPDPVNHEGKIVPENKGPEVANFEEGPPEWAKQTPVRPATPDSIDDDLAELAGKFEEQNQPKTQEALNEEEPTPTNEDTAKEEFVSADEDAQIEEQLKAYNGKPPKQLREAHKAALKRENALKAEAKQIQEKLATAEARLKEIESGATAPEPVLRQIEEVNKKLEEKEARLRILDYTQSEEFVSTYQQPLQKAYEKAYAEVEMMVVSTDQGDRKASPDDFKKVLMAPDPQTAGRLAHELFGQYGAQEVMQHRREIIALERGRREAISKANEESKQFYDRQQQTALQQRTNAVKNFQKVRQSTLEGRYKPLLGLRDNDKEGNEMVQNYLGKFEQLLTNGDDLDESSRVNLAAEMHAMAAAFPRELRDNRTLRDENAALKKQLEAFQKSEPRGGTRSDTSIKTKPADPMEAALNGIASLPKYTR